MSIRQGNRAVARLRERGLVLRIQNGSRCARFHAVHLARAALVLFGYDDKGGFVVCDA